jgi:hypothetical protein
VVCQSDRSGRPAFHVVPITSDGKGAVSRPFADPRHPVFTVIFSFFFFTPFAADASKLLQSRGVVIEDGDGMAGMTPCTAGWART